MPPPEPPAAVDDAALAGSEWLFKRDGQVYGPVDGARLAELLYAGHVAATTLVGDGDGRWRPLAEVPVFLVHVKKAEAARRVEEEVTGQRLLRARRARTRAAGLVAAGGLAVAGAVGLAVLRSRSAVAESPLLEGFGAGITIVAPARIGVARVPAEDEVEVELAPGGGRPAQRARARARANERAGPAPAPGAAGDVQGGDLVATQFDEARIEAVVGAEQRRLARCLREHAARDPGFEGEIPLEFTVGNEGRVVRVAVMDPRLREGPLRDCLEAELSRWRFPPFPGQRPTVSLTFRVGP
jgi:hypothetical protein